MADTVIVEAPVFSAGDPVRALHRLDAPSAGRLGPETANARRGVILELNGFWPVALVRFTCGGLSYVPLRRLDVDEDQPIRPCHRAGCSQPRWEGAWCPDHAGGRPSAGGGTTAQGSRRRVLGSPAAGPDRAVAQPPSPPPAPGRTGSAPGREAAGADTPAANRGSRRPGRPRLYTDELMVGELQAFAAEHGRPPAQGDFRIRRPNVAAYKRRFGSWGAALRAAGMEPGYGRGRKRTAA